MGCGCNKNKIQQNNTPVANTTAQVVDFSNDPNFIEVVYKGPEYSHYIGSPTGIIVKFGLRNYGLGKRGDKVKIHIEDYNKANWLYDRLDVKTEYVVINSLEQINSNITLTDIQPNIPLVETIEIQNENALRVVGIETEQISNNDYNSIENSLNVTDSMAELVVLNNKIEKVKTKNARKKSVN